MHYHYDGQTTPLCLSERIAYRTHCSDVINNDVIGMSAILGTSNRLLCTMNTIWLVFSTKKIPFVEGYLSSKQDQGGKKKYLNKLDIIIGLDL